MNKILIFGLTFFSLCTFAQEGLRPMRSNINYFYKDLAPEKAVDFTAPSQQKSLKVPDTIPFKEDFYYAPGSVRPDPAKWTDRTVYVNTGFAIAPPSIGVATFDGLDAQGYPYTPALLNMNQSFSADTLTSIAINLSSAVGVPTLQLKDSVGLSFYYQARGNGDPPETSDSLLLDFNRPNTNTWYNVWGARGQSNPNTNDTSFKRVFVWVDSAFYLQNGFRFRFRNKATTAGDFDHWNVDYILLDKNRSKKADTLYNDQTFAHVPGSYLKNYSAMPWKQYIPAEMAIKNSVRIKNNYNLSVNCAYECKFYDDQDLLVHAYNGFYFNLKSFKPFGYQTYPAHATPTFSYTFPSLTKTADYRIKHFIYSSVNSADYTIANDTVQQWQRFRDYYAFDDGSAEAGYYVKGTTGKIAQKITLNTSDVFRGMRIYFEPVGNMAAYEKYKFKIKIWTITNGMPDAEIYSSGDFSPIYYKTGFKDIPEYTVFNDLDKRSLGASTYFIGIQQSVADGISIGFDMNYNYMTSLYFDSGSGWQPSQFPGALMMRPLFGDYIEQPPLGMESHLNDHAGFSVYPNPASEEVTIHCEKEGNTFELRNALSQVVRENTIAGTEVLVNTSSLPTGVYILTLKKEGLPIGQKKLIIQR